MYPHLDDEKTRILSGRKDVKNNSLNAKEVVLLRREISLKVDCKKVIFSNCDFCNTFSDYNGHTYK